MSGDSAIDRTIAKAKNYFQADARQCSVALWGDSVLYGGYDLGESRLDEPPADALRRLRPRWKVTDHSSNGASATYFSDDFLRSELPERVQLIQYGHNDQILELPYEERMREMIEHAQAKKRSLIITGLSNVERTDKEIGYHAMARRLAQQHHVWFADFGNVEFHDGDTFDGRHPRPAYSLRLVQRIVQTLDQVAPECASS
ncbi:SGNH/GDSL hydrolase family protein [Xenophilus arseniciresistens]|uniref:SGNH/GDSL hydrolase family protein n=1 Tax=Xenophilus arseniciresistens TaxID=1283306 RepID=A0AAE3N7I0_9BURK|nr:SGNH/GDSL hydrolase family protein [Xenophilus arseniciresistens]MDA7415332.1 SGNH/GDSL hydrolase family protein [Xenophilus arseniciresistens]